GPFGINELVRALVRPAGGHNADDAVAAENFAYLVERIERCRLLVVVQVSVENCEALLRAGAGCPEQQSRQYASQCNRECRRPRCAYSHFISPFAIGFPP